MEINYRKIVFSMLLLAIVAMLTGTTVFAASPDCNGFNAQINPGNTTTYEKLNVTAQGGVNKGTIISCTWSQAPADAIQVTFNPSLCELSFTAPEVDPSGIELHFTLSATANVSGSTCSDSKSTKITIQNISNQAPTASATATPAVVDEGGTVTLDGSASSDSDGDQLTYVWTQTVGTSVIINNASGAIATFTAPAEQFPNGETLTFMLTVSDGSLSGSTTVNVTVNSVNQSPTAAISPQCPILVNEGATVTLDGSGSSDPDQVVLVYEWSQVLGIPNADLTGVDLTKFSISFTAPQLISSLNTMKFGLTVTDNGGLFASAECDIVVQDITLPVISGATDIIAEATSASGAVVNFTVTAHDAVDGDVTVTCDPTSGSTFALGVTTVNCSASDTAGNTATASFKVTVVDTTPPVIAAYGDVTAEATSASGAVVSYTSPATSDAVDGAGTANCLPASGGTFALGNTTVTCNATDAAGNKAVPTTFVVHVVDTTPPVIAAHGDVTAEATSASGAVVSYTSPATSDAVDGAGTANCLPASGGTFALGENTVTCNATDAAGNKAIATTFVVKVQDTTPPVLRLPSNITTDASGLSGAIVTYSASADDLVDGSVTPVCTPASGSTFAPGTTTVNCSATDSHGNRVSGSFLVTVKFRLFGFYSPIDINSVTNTVKGGSTVPMKFEVFAGATELTSTSAISSIKTQQISCSFVSSSEDPLPTDALATGGTSLRYDSTAGQFIYNWQTPKSAGTCFVVTMTTQDGSQISANFKLK